MARVVVTAAVEDAASWEEGFRTHGDLFESQTVTNLYFTVTKDNEAALYLDVDDLDKYLSIMDSPATAEAMEYDGVKRETVKIFVLDKEFEL